MEDINQWLVIAQEVAIEFGLNLIAAIVIFCDWPLGRQGHHPV